MLTRGDVLTVSDRFGLGEVVRWHGPTARGEQGQVFRLETSTGIWAVKQPFHPQLESDLAEEVDFQEAARAAGVPSPRIVWTRAGDVLLDLADGQARVYEWVDLRDPDPRLDPSAVGAAIGRLHGMPFAGTRGTHPWYSEIVGASRWDELIELLSVGQAPFASDLVALRDEIVCTEALVEPSATFQTGHRDLFCDNLRSTESGNLCVIDWENCGLVDPGQELALLLYQFAYAGGQRAHLLHKGYLEAGGTGRLTGPGAFSMLIAVLGHINERACTRWLAAAPDDPERARTASLFGEFAAEPLTIAVIDRLLTATVR